MSPEKSFINDLQSDISFLGTTPLSPDTKIAMLGVPADASTCFRPGARFGPHAIRQFSDNLETFSPIWQRDLTQIQFADMGDIPLPRTNNQKAFIKIESILLELLEQNLIPLCMGGDHSISYPILSAMAQKYPDLAIVQLDAHADLRVQYEGEKYSHACSMGNALTLFPAPGERLFQFGIRSFSREEYTEAMSLQSIYGFDNSSFDQVREIIGQRHVYLTIDLDVFDPAFFPGTGTPEAGGISYTDFVHFFELLKYLRLVGADAVELSPPYDPSGISAALAAKVVRDLIFLLDQNTN